MRTSRITPSFVASLACCAAALVPLARAQNCAGTSVGFTPLNDLGTGTYAGFQGGLYAGGSNVRPAVHETAGLAQAALVVPRDGAGAPNASGRVVLLSIGMSNTRNEWSEFMTLAASDSMRDPHVTVVMGAQGGQTAAEIRDPASPYWSFVDSQLAAAASTGQQVQAVWFKEANAGPTQPFPTHALGLQDDFTAILQVLHDRFPNLRLVYMTSRIYAGYATTTLNPEPWAYESGFAVKWTVEAQINGSAALNFDPASGPVEAPWISWGPYMWADGLVPRSDGLTWLCSDYNPDGTHPNPMGSLKVAQALLEMFHNDPTATPWYVGTGGPGGPVQEFCFGDGLDPAVTTDCPCANSGAPGHGCAHSFNAAGARLSATGATNPDTIVLHASEMPGSASSLYLKGSANTPSGIVFGDGVRCIDGTILRMGIKINVDGASQYPETGNASVSVRGGNTPGSGVTAFYQTYYRNAASYCTPATFNITSGVAITW